MQHSHTSGTVEPRRALHEPRLVLPLWRSSPLDYALCTRRSHLRAHHSHTVSHVFASIDYDMALGHDNYDTRPSDYSPFLGSRAVPSCSISIEGFCGQYEYRLAWPLHPEALNM